MAIQIRTLQKKPVQAAQFIGGRANAEGIIQWVTDNGGSAVLVEETLVDHAGDGVFFKTYTPYYLRVHGRQSPFNVKPSEWVFLSENGDFYRGREDVVEKTYIHISEEEKY